MLVALRAMPVVLAALRNFFGTRLRLDVDQRRRCDPASNKRKCLRGNQNRKSGRVMIGADHAPPGPIYLTFIDSMLRSRVTP